MIKDLYIRKPSDPNYVYGVMEHSNIVERIITKIKVILGTRRGDVLGDMNFGVGIEDKVFETQLNQTELEEEIQSQIEQYISESAQYQISSKVSFGRAEGYDYAVIDFYIDSVKTAGILIR